MPNHHCCVPGCTSDKRKVNNPVKYPTLAGVTFLSFPSAAKHPCTREHWAELSGRSSACLTIHTRICSRHFPEGRPTADNPHPTLYDKDPRTERKGSATVKTGKSKRGKASTAVPGRKPQVPTKKQRLALIDPLHSAAAAAGDTKRTHKRKATGETHHDVSATSIDEKPIITSLYKRCKLEPTEGCEFYGCGTCVRGFTTTKELQVHLSATHGECSRDVSEQSGGPFFCNACGVSFSDEDAFALHLGSHIIKTEDVKSKKKKKKKKSKNRTKHKKGAGALPGSIAERRYRIGQANNSSLKVYRILGNSVTENGLLLNVTQPNDTLVRDNTSTNGNTNSKEGLSTKQESPAQVEGQKVVFGSQILSGGVGSSCTQAVSSLKGCRVYRIVRRTVNNVSQTTTTDVTLPFVNGVNQAGHLSGNSQSSGVKLAVTSIDPASVKCIASVRRPSVTTVNRPSVTAVSRSTVTTVNRPSVTAVSQESLAGLAVAQTTSTVGSVTKPTESGDKSKIKSNEKSSTNEQIHTTEKGPKILAPKNLNTSDIATKIAGIKLKEQQVSNKEVTSVKNLSQKKPTPTGKLETEDSDNVDQWDSSDDGDSPRSYFQPAFVCPQCRDEFTSMQELRFHIRTHGFVLCVSCGKFCGSLVQLVTHTTSESHDDLVPCTQCGLGLATAEHLEKHSVLHQITFTITCDTLSQNVYEFFDFLKIVYSKSFDDLNLSPESEDAEGERIQRTNLGLFPWESSTVGKPQEELAEPPQFPNLLKTNNESDLINDKIHLSSSDDSETKQKGKQIWVCLICRNVCVGLDAYKDHVSKVHTAAGPFDTRSDIISCHICHTYFETPQARWEHMKRHHGVNDRSKLLNYLPYKCSICSERFDNKAAQKRHIQTHRDDYIPCQLCKDVFSTRPELDHHILHAHMNQPPKVIPRKPGRPKKTPILCDICGHTAISPSSMLEHKATHSEERKFACGLCDLRFKTLSRCKSHIKRHTQAGSCQCHQCPKSFSTKADLEMHLRFHNDVRPYPCPQCGRAFHTNQNMRVHMQKYCKGEPTTTKGASKKKKK